MHVESAVLGVYMHSLATSRCMRREGCGNFFCETTINFLICRSSQVIYAALAITNCGNKWSSCAATGCKGTVTRPFPHRLRDWMWHVRLVDWLCREYICVWFHSLRKSGYAWERTHTSVQCSIMSKWAVRLVHMMPLRLALKPKLSVYVQAKSWNTCFSL